MYNHELFLQTDVKHNLDKNESKERENREDRDAVQSFDLDFYDAIFPSVTKIQTIIVDDTADSIKAA